MAHSTETSTQGTQPNINTMKIYPIHSDAEKLNFVVKTGQDETLQFLKVSDESKGSRLRLNDWHKIRDFKIVNGSITLVFQTSISHCNAIKPKINPDHLQQAKKMLKQRKENMQTIAQAKSDEFKEGDFVTIRGKLVTQGRIESKTRLGDGKPFTLQKMRIADETATIRISAFNCKKTLVKGHFYTIHLAKKRNYQGRIQIEINEATKIEEKKSIGIEKFCEDMSENEDENELDGEVSGIVWGSTILYEGCSTHKKKMVNGKCPTCGGCISISQIRAKIDLEYEDADKGPQDIQLTLFNTQLQELLGKDCSKFEDSNSLEEEFALFCPIKIKFQIADDKDGKKKLLSCRVVTRSAPGDWD